MTKDQESNIRKITENPRYIFQTPEAQKWSPNTLRFLRVAVMNHLNVDPTEIYTSEKYRANFTKLCITGTHESAHMHAARERGSGVTGKVFKNGNGITNFILNARDLREYVRDINYVGYMGKFAEEALGEIPHGHGFDMDQNDAYANYLSEITGNSGSSVQNEAASWARSTVRSRLDNMVNEGVRLALAA